jgi:hypothetical protein
MDRHMLANVDTNGTVSSLGNLKNRWKLMEQWYLMTSHNKFYVVILIFIIIIIIIITITIIMGTAIAQWLRYCATNQKVAGSIPDFILKFFIDINPSDSTMALGSTQPLTEMSTRRISWG